jgi:hypothetical protein
MSPLLSRLPSDLVNLHESFIDVKEAFMIVAFVAAIVNQKAHDTEFWKHSMDATKLIALAAHCVLTLPRLSLRDSVWEGLDCHLREILRLALLVFLAMLKTAFRALSAVELDPFLARLVAMIPSTRELQAFPELIIWINFLVASTNEDEVPDVVLCGIRNGMRDLGITAAEDAMQIARNVIWIDSFSNSTVERLAIELGNRSLHP